MTYSGLLIRGARQLLTLRGPAGPRRGLELLDLGVIPDGAVLIQRGVIQAVGPGRQILSLAATRDCREIDATGRVVMPAFIDSATSPVHARPSPRSIDRMLRSYGTETPESFEDGLAEGARNLASLTSNALKQRATRVGNGMARYGTLTARARPAYALDETSLFKVLRIQSGGTGAVSWKSSLLLKPGTEHSPEDWARWTCEEVLPKVRKRKLADSVDLEYGPHGLTTAAARSILRSAADMGFDVHVHADPCLPAAGLDVALESGAVSFGQLCGLQDPQLEALARSSTIALLNPGYTLQTGIESSLRGREMLEMGVIPALSSGYHPQLSPSYNMQLMLFLASRYYRFSPEEAISAATVNNAYALGVGGMVGSIETGKRADLLVLEVSDYRELAYYAGVNIVEKVIKRGMVVHDTRHENLQVSPGVTSAISAH